MSAEEIPSVLRRRMIDLFDLKEEQIVAEARLVEDLGLDSLDAIDMAVQIQELTGRRVEEPELRALRTIADVDALVRQLCVAA